MKKLTPLSDNDREAVKKFFSTGETSGLGKGRLWFLYGRMRAHGELIPEAETVLERRAILKREAYKNQKEMEIQQGLHDFENEHQEAGWYEVVKVNEWSNGRSLVISIPTISPKGGVQNSHTVEIDEFMNPEYFSECMLRYAPKKALQFDKPF